MTNILEEIAYANSLFRSTAPTRLMASQAQIVAGNASSALLTAVNDPEPKMFQPNENTTGSVIKIMGQLPNDVPVTERVLFSKTLKDQEFYLQSGMGMVTSWLSNTYKDPVDWADHTKWQDPLSALPELFYTKNYYKIFDHIKCMQREI